ncbi:NADPH-dependent F420 reductase [Chamaesiphon minutus]|uniref:Putative dinucleotide-binding enzyme n=1 Tax=Chamaesiphon minutus (strain ATCC 27169 / PCC 6605) TaxID=1173020 RepID=K9UEW7_CHAP6|nr:NAD(P)-binding domain-containing protein [Chamaesiphon minutus]AFY92744.1 putative dinucleotide-binding enzyme [Chamaesiphon minutus PCC 6605]
MKIGIIGSGNMGRSLGILWAEQGHQVFFGARTAEKGKAVAESAGQGTQGGTNDEAAAFGDVILYSARGVDPVEVLSSTAVLTGKILIDPNNSTIPAEFAYEPIEKSLAEILAEQVPNAIVVKAFNTMAQEVFELAPEPLRGHRVSVFVASDNETARQTVMQLAEEIGFVAIDSGRLRNARMIETIGDFIRFVIIGQQQGSYATISVDVLPAVETQRLGGRQASDLK